MKNCNQLKIGSLLSYAQMAIAVVISLAYTPIMLRLLGQSEYGLYNTIASTISLLSLLSLGFNSGYIRYYSRYKSKDDFESIWKLNGLFLVIFIIIGVVGFGCGIFISFNLEIVFSDGFTLSEYKTAKVLVWLLSFNLAISFPMSVFSNIISANEHFVCLKLIGIIKTVAGPLVTLPILMMGLGSIGMVVGTLIVSVFSDIIYVYYVIHILNNRFVFRGFEKGIFRDLLIYTSFIAINMLVDQLNWNVDKILLGRYRGTDSVAVYSVGYMLYQYYMMLSTSISSVFTPRIHKIVNETSDNKRILKEQLTKLFIKVGRIQFILLGLVASGVVFYGKQFITKYWAGNDYGESYYVVLLLVLPASIALIQNIGIEIQRAQNKHQFRAIVYIIMAALNVIISIELCQLYGAIGSAIGTAVSLIIANGIIINFYYHLKCNIDVIAFWKSLFRLALGMLPAVLYGIILNQRLWGDSLIEYLASIFLYIIIYCSSMWLFGLNKSEKQLFSKPIGRLVSRIYGRDV